MIKTNKDLRRYRNSLGLTQVEFAKKYNISISTLYRLEAGITLIEDSFFIKMLNTTIIGQANIGVECIKKVLSDAGLGNEVISKVLLCNELAKK